MLSTAATVGLVLLTASLVPGSAQTRDPSRSPTPLPRPLPTPPTDPARSLLEVGDRTALATALRWAGVDAASLIGGRETTNLGRLQPPDRWRLPSAEAALENPLWLPDRVGDVGRALSDDLAAADLAAADLAAADLAAPVPGWDGLRPLARQELGWVELDGCPVQGGRSLLQAARERGEGLPSAKRQLAYLQQQISPDLDAVAGDLLAQAAGVHCQLTRAFAGLSPADRTAVIDTLGTGLWQQDLATDERRAARAVALATAWEHIDRARLAAAGVAWSQAVRGASQTLGALPLTAWPTGPVVLQTGLGAVWIGSPDADIMQGDPVLILDPGGDDDWIVAPQRRLSDPSWVPPVRGVVELGGDDRYSGGALSVGGALLGVSSGADLGGSDTWRTGELSQGAAWFGVSTWLDVGGDDVFVGPDAVQGFAAFGLGMLRLAGAGDDTLRAGAWAQGSAGTGGVGVLHDGGGDDRYVLGGSIEDSPRRLPGHFDAYGQGFSAGQRPWLGGGLGWLQDDAGHDHYAGGLWCQGSSHWHSLGVLLDRQGNDLYTADQYSQGSGVHLSAAGLFDLGGDDRYLVRKLGQGSGHDLSVSWLLDGQGDDVYTGQDGVQGVAINNAVAFFIDRQGDDLYVAPTARRHGFVDVARGYSGVAAFIDGAGQDRKLLADSGVAEVDADPPPAPSDPPGTASSEDVPQTADQARSLLRDHQRWQTTRQDSQQAAQQLFDAGPQAVGWLLPLTNGEFHLRSLSIGAVVKRWARDGTATQRQVVADAVLDSLRDWPPSDLDDSVRWHLGWLGVLAAADPALHSQAVVAVDLSRGHPSWVVRQAAWRLAAELAEDGALPRVMGQTWLDQARDVLASPSEVAAERAVAAFFVGEAGDGQAAAQLAVMLSHGDLAERAAAEQALVSLAHRGGGRLVLAALDALARGSDSASRDAALRAAGASGLSAGLVLVELGLASDDVATRRAAAQGLAENASPAALRLAARYRRNERDPRVLSALSQR